MCANSTMCIPFGFRKPVDSQIPLIGLVVSYYFRLPINHVPSPDTGENVSIVGFSLVLALAGEEGKIESPLEFLQWSMTWRQLLVLVLRKRQCLLVLVHPVGHTCHQLESILFTEWFKFIFICYMNVNGTLKGFLGGHSNYWPIVCKGMFHKGKQKSPERATSRSRSQPPTPGGREKVTQFNVCIANKQMHDKQKDQLPLPQARWSKC